MREDKFCPRAVTPSTANYRSSEKSNVWSTLDEVEWLTRLARDNSFAFSQYKRNFYHRTNWRGMNPAYIAHHLGLAWPKPPEA